MASPRDLAALAAAPSNSSPIRRRSAVGALSTLVCAALILASCGNGDEVATTSFTRVEASDIGANPFMASVEGPVAASSPIDPNIGLVNVRSSASAPESTTTTEPPPATPGDQASTGPSTPVVGVVGAGGPQTGDTPGLYGGTRNAASCDATKMVAFLNANPGIAGAWAGVLGIQPTDIDAYVATLTPAVLRSDTAVTNHGLKGRVATRIPAVLQAGTAVLVDAKGRPVVKCACGNPLTAPATGRRSYSGPSWSGFAEQDVTEITTAAEALQELILVDLLTNRTFARPVGNDGDADVPATVPPTPDSTVGSTPDSSGSTTTSVEPAAAPTTTTTLPISAPSGEDVVVDVTNVGGVCAGIPADPLTLRITRSTSGGSITFYVPYGQPPRVVPIQADGSFADEVSLSPPGLSGGTATIRWSGRVDSGSPLVISGSISTTVTGGPGGGSCDTNFATPTTAPTGEPATTAPVVTTTIPPTIPATTTSTILVVAPFIPLPAAPTEGNWYFSTSLAANGCDYIDVVDGGRGRLRIHDGGGDDWTITWLIGRGSTTLTITADQFRSFNVNEGLESIVERRRSYVGAIPSLTDDTSRSFAYTSSFRREGDANECLLSWNASR